MLALLLSCFQLLAQESSSSLQLNLKSSQRHQLIKHFGASDAWSIQYVGKDWEEDKKEQIAQWLFSNELGEDGSPLGIGLTTWRYNIGAGSAEQGDASEIKDPWRRSFGIYDSLTQKVKIANQAGQLWFLKKAKTLGVEHFTAFANSPPCAMTKNRLAHGGGETSLNLSRESYPLYAQFLSDFLMEMEKEQIHFDLISPFNEPQWDWGKKNGQEGTAAQNDEIAEFVSVLDKTFQQHQLKTKIEVAESAQYNYAYDPSSNRPERDHQLWNFFHPESPNYIGDLQLVSPSFSAHAYFTTSPLSKLKSSRQVMGNLMKDYKNLSFYQSEYCLLENNEEVKGKGKDLGIDPALYMAKVMHYDLTVANAASWQWWISVSPYDYKDGLIYVDKKDKTIVEDSKCLWVLGNYSRFVKPGMQRISAQLKGQFNQDELLVSAFQSKNETVTVIVNLADQPFDITLQSRKKKQVYITSATENLKHTSCKDKITIQPRSVTTIVK
ncbi:glycoside hydrolase [Flammeovirga aprica]|uniref:Xylanase n=1 Tax=Flammeovirga aprica JL-4 TaxID=694437 RepID=A0A7X9RUU7_9BACT|nr:glycoside hydrolase [Flammeovirga aprica]NME69140.1 xylanase [Flammeovirga aprica JL-4]